MVGPCYVHGLMNAEGLLGPVPSPWIARVGSGRDEISWSRATWFVHASTKERTLHEPRLSPLSPHEWEEVQGDNTLGPEHRGFHLSFRNKQTGQVLDSDPRMQPEALRQRGVDLEVFRLV